MKVSNKLATLALLAFCPLAHAQGVQKSTNNFNAGNYNGAIVCNNTDQEQPNNKASSPYFGRTNIAVLFSALGCAGMAFNQTYVCSAQYDIQAGECARYHFKGGTHRQHAEIGLPNAHSAPNQWNFGSADGNGHFIFSVNNQYRGGVKKLGFYQPSYFYDNAILGVECNANDQCFNSRAKHYESFK